MESSSVKVPLYDGNNYTFDVCRGASYRLLKVIDGGRLYEISGEGIKGRLDFTEERRRTISLVTESKMS